MEKEAARKEKIQNNVERIEEEEELSEVRMRASMKSALMSLSMKADEKKENCRSLPSNLRSTGVPMKRQESTSELSTRHQCHILDDRFVSKDISAASTLLELVDFMLDWPSNLLILLFESVARSFTSLTLSLAAQCLTAEFD